MLRRLYILFFISFFILLHVGYALADGIIIVEPIPGIITRPTPLIIKYHRVKVEIDHQVATTSIDQVFRNEYNADLEGTYIFPLPEDAAISEFSLYIDGKKTQGELLDKDKARKIYEDIVRKMRDPGLLEYVGRNMFKARVYPIPKLGERRIELVYQETVKYDAGLCNYVYPLNTEKFSPKPLEDISIYVKIKSKIPIKSLYSPSHEIDTSIDNNQATCGYEAKNVQPDKDFILYYAISDKDFGLNLLTHRRQNEDGYFLLMLSPGEIASPEKVISKNIIFVLDTSGSMAGDKLKQAKEALKFCINNLNANDDFNIISFATDIHPFDNQVIPNNEEHREKAIHFINGLKAIGGTNINDALLSALKMTADKNDNPFIIIFLTDGLPTVGVTDPQNILKNVAAANRENIRIFVFGVGYDVNTHLLDKIAEKHKGVSMYITPQEDIEVKVSSFYSKISSPVLADTTLDFGKIMVRDLYPQPLPDLFKGSLLTLLGRYKGEGHTPITLGGKIQTLPFEMVYEDTFPEENDKNPFVPRLWATRKIGYLLSEIRLHGESKELKDEIIGLSKEFGIMTPYTSFLVLEDEKDYEQWGIRKEELHLAKRSFEAEKGEGSVDASSDISKLKAQSVVAPPGAGVSKKGASKNVRYISDKTFYLRDNVWVDSLYKEDGKVVEVAYLSDEYFLLLKKYPALGKYLAIGKYVKVYFEGKRYYIKK